MKGDRRHTQGTVRQSLVPVLATRAEAKWKAPRVAGPEPVKDMPVGAAYCDIGATMDTSIYTVTQQDLDTMVERLRPHAQAIRKDADRGDYLGMTILELYAMLHRRVEHGSLALLSSALDEWLARGQDESSLGPETVSTRRNEAREACGG